MSFDWNKKCFGAFYIKTKYQQNFVHKLVCLQYMLKYNINICQIY